MTPPQLWSAAAVEDRRRVVNAAAAIPREMSASLQAWFGVRVFGPHGPVGIHAANAKKVRG